MSQERLREWREPLGSEKHNRMNLGFHNPGRFSGFDTIVPQSGLQFSLSHVGSGIKFKDTNGTLIGPCGTFMTPQGVLIIESEPIPDLQVDTNVGNNSVRYDLLVADHQFVGLTGGNPATYSFIKGPINSTLKPIPSDPLLQTVIGYIKIPANAATVSSAKFIRSKSPDSGDGEDARLAEVNFFQKTQNFSQIGNDDFAINPPGFGVPNTVTDFFVLKETGNVAVFKPQTGVGIGSLRLDGPDVANGLELAMLVNSNVTFTQRPLITQEVAAGFHSIFVPEEDSKPGTVLGTRILPIPAGKTALVRMVLVDGVFVIYYRKVLDFKSITDGIRVGMYVDTDMTAIEMNQRFDATGFGIGDWEGYALPNGNNYPLPDGSFRQTTDLRNRWRVTTNELNSVGVPNPIPFELGDGYSIGGYYGSRFIRLIRSNLPNIQLKMSPLVKGAGGINNDNNGGGFGYGDDKSTPTRPEGVITTETMGGGTVNAPNTTIDIAIPSLAVVTVLKIY